MIGGLLDGYRDSIPRMMQSLRVPMKAIIGPGNHAFPDDMTPGPHTEWRHDVVRWWNHWLKDSKSSEVSNDLAEMKVFIF